MEILEGLDFIESLIKEKKQEIDLMKKKNIPDMSFQEMEKAIKDLDKLDVDLEFLQNSCKRTFSLLKLCTAGEMDMNKVEEEFNEVIDNLTLYFR